MNDTAFVAGAYVAALGTIGAYAVFLARRLRAARSARTAIEAQTVADAMVRPDPPVP